MAVRRFELVDGKSSKFWEIEQTANQHTVCYGRIGTNGQSKTKEFDSTEAAQKDAEKLIASKVKKGYQEVADQVEAPAAEVKQTAVATESGKQRIAVNSAPVSCAPVDGRASGAASHRQQSSADIDDLIDAGDPAQALFDYLKPLLTQSAECEELLRELTATARDVEVYDDGSMQFTIDDEDDDDEEFVITFAAPFEEEIDESVPNSMADFCRVHNGVGWTSYLDSGFNGLNDSDGTVASGGWDADYLLQAEEDNEAFLEKLSAADLDEDDVPGPFDYGQNWLVIHPAEKNAIGESKLYFVSHEDCEATEVENADNLKWGPIVLRVMYESMCGDAGFDEIYD